MFISKKNVHFAKTLSTKCTVRAAQSTQSELSQQKHIFICLIHQQLREDRWYSPEGIDALAYRKDIRLQFNVHYTLMDEMSDNAPPVCGTVPTPSEDLTTVDYISSKPLHPRKQRHRQRNQRLWYLRQSEAWLCRCNGVVAPTSVGAYRPHNMDKTHLEQQNVGYLT